MNTYLCLDLASKTGWGIMRDGALLASGTQDFTKRRGETNGILFLKFRNWLTTVMLPHLDTGGKGARVLVYEQARFRGGAATELCVGLQTHAQSWAADHGVECVPVQTQVLKKHATGKGNAPKEAMMAAAGKILGRPPIDDNEADAVHIGTWAVENLGK